MERAWESVVIQMQSVNRALVEFQYVFASLVTEEMGGSVQVNCLHSLLWSSLVCLFVYKVFFRALFPLADIDECFRKDQDCHKEAECVNTVGSFNCSCKLGFEGDGADCKRTMAHCIN